MLNVECSGTQARRIHPVVGLTTAALVLLFTFSLSAQTTNVVRPALRLRTIVPRVANTNSAVSATAVRATTTTPVTPEVQVPLPATIELPPGAEPPLNSLPGFAPGGTNAAAKAKTPEEKQLQELLKLKFDRSASSILDALAEQMNEKSSTNAVETFKRNVTIGKWDDVGAFLKTLPGDQGKQVYRYLLKELANPSRTPAQPNMPD